MRAMGWLKAWRKEDRAASARLSDPYLAEFFGMNGGALSHVDVTRATGTAVALACITLIATSLAMVPLVVYQRGDRGARDKALAHPLYGLLHDQPNPWQTAFEFREAEVRDLLSFGNAYAEVTWNGRGQPAELRRIHPREMAVERRRDGRLRYRVTGTSNRILLPEEVLHLRYQLAPDGIMGLSPIQLARETFNLAMVQGETAHKMARKGFRPEGILSFPGSLGQDARQRLMDTVGTKLERDDTTSRVLIMDGGAEWKPQAISPRDSEFLESRKLSALDIARVFGVPPSAVGITDNSTYSNIGEESRALVQRCLAPMARRIEQAMNAALLSTEARRTYFVEHDLAGLLRGDLAARYAAYRTGRDGGWLSPNEIRRFENLPEIDGGDEYLSPLNMRPQGQKGGTDGSS